MRQRCGATIGQLRSLGLNLGLYAGTAENSATNQLANTHQLGYNTFMEKRTPHCKLTVVKALVEAGKVRATHSARLGATGLGLELSDMLAVVLALTAA